MYQLTFYLKSCNFLKSYIKFFLRRLIFQSYLPPPYPKLCIKKLNNYLLKVDKHPGIVFVGLNIKLQNLAERFGVKICFRSMIVRCAFVFRALPQSQHLIYLFKADVMSKTDYPEMSFSLQSCKQSESKMLRRTQLLKFILFSLCLMTVMVVMFMNINDKGLEMTKENAEAEKVVVNVAETVQMKLVHLDLKGAPPKMSYLFKVLPLLKLAGANGLLIEYEDMFPWSGKLKNISAGNAYSLEEVKSLISYAKDLDLEVIPLVQTFGHLEFVLKLAEFRHLRELDLFPQEICPAKYEALQLIKEMIRQIMTVHEGTQYLHIGCDEVYHLSACSTCSLKSPRTTFINHVKKVSGYVKDHYPGVTTIIWDDMLRHWSPTDIEDSGLGKFVEPMVWVYIDDITHLVPQFIWYVYKKTFPKLWVASAFKGAFGEKEILPDLPRHIKNNVAWLQLMKPEPIRRTFLNADDFRGIALTGWSRYDHFAVLAELLVVSIPSLIVNLALVDKYLCEPFGRNLEPISIDKAIEVLNCPKTFPYRSIKDMANDKHQFMFGMCLYPGSNIYPLIQEYVALQFRYNIIMDKMHTNGWITEYNLKHNYSSPFRVLEFIPDEGFAANTLKIAMISLKNGMSAALSEYYDDHTVKEWLEQKIDPMISSLGQLEKNFQILIETKTWPRRPIS